MIPLALRTGLCHLAWARGPGVEAPGALGCDLPRETGTHRGPVQGRCSDGDGGAGLFAGQ